MIDRQIRRSVERQSLCRVTGTARFDAYVWTDVPLLGCDVLELRGDMTSSTVWRVAQQLGSWVETRTNTSTHLDLSGIDSIDGQGVSLLVELHRRGNRRGGWLFVGQLRPSVTSRLARCDVDALSELSPAAAVAIVDRRRHGSGVGPS